MSSIQINVNSTQHHDANFAWYRVYGSVINHALVDVAANAEWAADFFSTKFIHANLAVGSTWYHWAQPVYDNGDAEGDLVALGSETIPGGLISLGDIQDIDSDRLLGRDSAGTGTVEQLTVDTTLEFTGSGGIRRAALSGDISAAAGSNVTAIGANKVTLAMQAQLAASRFLGRVTAGTGNVEAMTGTQATTLLDTFTSALKGLAPASGGGTSNFLRADGTWAAPSGGSGTVTSISAGTGITLTPSPITTTGSVAITTNGVSNALLRQGGALSVIGRSANSTGNVADISATAASGAVLRESGSTLGFGTIATAGIADDAVTYAKIQNVSAAPRVLGRTTAGAGNIEELTTTGTGNVAFSASPTFTGTVAAAAATFSGLVQVDRLEVTGTTIPQVGIYEPSADVLGLAAGGQRIWRADVSAGSLRFYNTSTVITGASNALEGATLASGYSWFASNDSIYVQRPNNTDGSFVTFYKGSSDVGSIDVSGSTTSYNTTSDRNLKLATGALDPGALFDEIEIQRGTWLFGREGPWTGVFAQDLQRLVPEAVTPARNPPGMRVYDPGYRPWKVDLTKLIPYMAAELKSLRSRVALLEAA